MIYSQGYQSPLKTDVLKLSTFLRKANLRTFQKVDEERAKTKENLCAFFRDQLRFSNSSSKKKLQKGSLAILFKPASPSLDDFSQKTMKTEFNI